MPMIACKAKKSRRRSESQLAPRVSIAHRWRRVCRASEGSFKLQAQTSHRFVRVLWFDTLVIRVATAVKDAKCAFDTGWHHSRFCPTSSDSQNLLRLNRRARMKKRAESRTGAATSLVNFGKETYVVQHAVYWHSNLDMIFSRVIQDRFYSQHQLLHGGGLHARATNDPLHLQLGLATLLQFLEIRIDTLPRFLNHTDVLNRRRICRFLVPVALGGILDQFFQRATESFA